MRLIFALSVEQTCPKTNTPQWQFLRLLFDYGRILLPSVPRS